MITTNLTGNFGNHMWYYCLCRIIAEELGYDWGINPVATHDYYNGKSQFYFMDVDYGKLIKVNGKNSKGLNTYEGIVNEYYDSPKIYNGCCINMYDKNVFNISDHTMIHLISQSEDYLINRKNDILNWFKIKEKYKKIYENKLSELGIVLDKNMCVINFRGGEYKSVPNLILNKDYWSNCIKHMLLINPNMKFIIITDDPNCATSYIGNYPCYHVDIGFDFYVINQSQYIILSNSSFGWWAAWMNTQSKLTIAPKYWSQYNVSDGYWGLGDQYTRCFIYMDRSGTLFNYESCKEEAMNYYKSKNLI
jgi:hypothetical protein